MQNDRNIGARHLRLLAAITNRNKVFNKIFCIGMNKTGTTSLAVVLSILGYKLADQKEGEKYTVYDLNRGNFSPLIKYIEKYDAFQDMPFCMGQTYVALDALFPGSKFILTIRDPDEWFQSLLGFHSSILEKHIYSPDGRPDKKTIDDWDYIYKGYSSENIKLHWLTTPSDNLDIEHNWSLLYDKDHYTDVFNKRMPHIRPGSGKDHELRLSSALLDELEHNSRVDDA